jgi:uncharacterized protein (UPF0335 family)
MENQLNVSTEDMEKLLKDLYVEFSRIDNESRHLSERKKELKEYAKKKGINLKALDESLKQLKKPREEREHENYQVNLYINILEDVV